MFSLCLSIYLSVYLLAPSPLTYVTSSSLIVYKHVYLNIYLPIYIPINLSAPSPLTYKKSSSLTLYKYQRSRLQQSNNRAYNYLLQLPASHTHHAANTPDQAPTQEGNFLSRCVSRLCGNDRQTFARAHTHTHTHMHTHKHTNIHTHPHTHTHKKKENHRPPLT